MMFSILIFMGAAVAAAAFLVVFGTRTSRDEQRQLGLAREREQSARRDAERARALRARWEARIAEEQLLEAATDRRHSATVPRDADGHVIRHRRPGLVRRDVPAPFISPG